MINKNETSIKERLSYGLSDAADNLVFQMMTTYLMFFYTDIYGISASQTAILFVVARIADIFESVIIGQMIDHTKSRFGKSRPFFLWYALPYVIFAVLTFVTPNFSQTGKLVWAYITYLGLGFLYTCVNLPITSILPTLTKNDHELTILGVIRQFCGSSVQIIVAVFTLPLVSLFGHGNQRKGFFWTIVLFSIISFFLIINTFLNVKERHQNKDINHSSIKDVWKMVKKNHPWIILSFVILVYWLTTSIKNQTTIYYFKYVINHENLVPIANAFTFSSLFGILLILHASKKYCKKQSMLGGIVIGFIGQLLISVGVYSNSLIILFVGIFINSIGNGIIIGLVSIMIADTIHYGISLGVQAEGILASTDDFGVNVGLGLGGLITAGLLHVSGYIPNHAQNTATISMINLNFVWLPMLLYVVMFVILLFYNGKVIRKSK